MVTGSQPAPQELFGYLLPYRVLACRLCETGIPLSQLVSHIRAWHRGFHACFKTPQSTTQWVNEQLLLSLPSRPISPFEEAVLHPPYTSLPLSLLKVFTGHGCSHCEYVCKAESDMRQHYNESHAKIRQRRGGVYTTPGLARDRADRQHYGDQVPWRVVSYQRFYKVGGIKGQRCFRVQAFLPPDQEKDERCLAGEAQNQADRISSAVFAKLTHLQGSESVPGSQILALVVKSQVSPWIERTRWLQYLDGVNLQALARLVDLEPTANEAILAVLFSSIDRLIEAAYQSIHEDRLNFFGQKKIASFLPQKSGYSAPLVYKLQQATYKTYKLTWKRLLAFIWRTNTPFRAAQLKHRLTPQQTALYDALIMLASHLASDSGHATQSLDMACLDLCIALLDDQLHGNIYESPVISFLAVLGIDESNNAFYEASNYTSKLSGFIKIA